MQLLLPGWLGSTYVLGPLGLVSLLLLVALVRRRRSIYSKTCKKLGPVVGGKIQHDKTAGTLTGEYRGHPVVARFPRELAQASNTFHVTIPAGPGGRDWEIAHRSEKLLGPESWRAFTKDPALQSRLEAARVPERFQGWPRSTVVVYDARRGTLSLAEQFSAPSADHFRAQLDVLEAMLQVNRDLNGE